MRHTFDKYRLDEIVLAPIVRSLNSRRYRMSPRPIPRMSVILRVVLAVSKLYVVEGGGVVIAVYGSELAFPFLCVCCFAFFQCIAPNERTGRSCLPVLPHLLSLQLPYIFLLPQFLNLHQRFPYECKLTVIPEFQYKPI